MMRWIPMVLLVVGMAITGALGAMNSEHLTDYRTAHARVQDLSALQKELEACAETETPEPCRQQAREPRRASGLLGEGQSVERALAEAEATEQAVGLPAPGQRLVGWANRAGLPWIVGVVLIVVGAVLARRQRAAEASGATEATEEQIHFPAAVAEIRALLDDLAQEIADLPMEDDAPAVRERIEDLEADLILPVVDGRGRFIARHGIGPFAEYFSPFSAGERNLSRTWSALTDGHAVVAREALAASRSAFARAAEVWDEVEARQGGQPWQPRGPAREGPRTESDVSAPRPSGMIEEPSVAGSAALGAADIALDSDESILDPDTVSDPESVSDADTFRAAPDAEERPLRLEEKEEIRALVAEGAELLEALVFVGFDIDDSDAVVDALHNAVSALREGRRELPERWSDPEVATQLLGLLWGEHVARVAGWRWVRLVVVGLHDGLAVVSPDRAHALFPVDYLRALLDEPQRENSAWLVYEMVRDRNLLPAAPGTRTLIS